MLAPIFNAPDGEWVTVVGRYMLNMGVVEFATRSLSVDINGTDKVDIFREDLSTRLSYLRKRFPREDRLRHRWASNVFTVAERHVGFRNIVAHSAVVIAKRPNETLHVVGLVNATPIDKQLAAEIISLEELTGRVEESAQLGRDFTSMQPDYMQKQSPNKAVERTHE